MKKTLVFLDMVKALLILVVGLLFQSELFAGGFARDRGGNFGGAGFAIVVTGISLVAFFFLNNSKGEKESEKKAEEESMAAITRVKEDISEIQAGIHLKYYNNLSGSKKYKHTLLLAHIKLFEVD